jgi:hypothetical protein
MKERKKENLEMKIIKRRVGISKTTPTSNISLSLPKSRRPCCDF